MPGKQRAILLLLAVAAVIVAIIVVPSLGDDEDSGDEPATVQTTPAQTNGGTATAPVEEPKRPAAKRITVRAGKPVGAVKRLSYERGETVEVVITSDTTDEVHVHGYDLTKPLPAARPARLRFRATIEGIFEIELHGSGEQIAELRVRP